MSYNKPSVPSGVTVDVKKNIWNAGTTETRLSNGSYVTVVKDMFGNVKEVKRGW